MQRRCKARRALLHGPSPDGRLGCRGCLGLAYEIESEPKRHRALRKFHRLTDKLGDPIRKPKRMHRRTYRRLLRDVLMAQGAALGPTGAWLERFKTL